MNGPLLVLTIKDCDSYFLYLSFSVPTLILVATIVRSKMSISFLQPGVTVSLLGGLSTFSDPSWLSLSFHIEGE